MIIKEESKSFFIINNNGKVRLGNKRGVTNLRKLGFRPLNIQMCGSSLF